MRRPLPLVLVVLVLLAAAAARAADLASEVSWIGNLGGVTVTNTQNVSGAYEQTYLVQNPDRTLTQVRDGLKQRGWTVVKNSDVSAMGASVRSLKAQKSGMLMEVSVQDAGIVCSLNVRVLSSGGATSSSGGGSSRTGGSTTAAGPVLVLSDANQEGSYDLNGSAVVINSSNSEFRFTGRGSTITLNGSNNEIRVQGAATRVIVNGSNNSVYWSASANPQGVAVQDNGSNNEVTRTP